MVRPATLDRVENGGPGSDNNPRERKIGGPHSTTERSSGPRPSSLPPCSKLSRRGLETRECAAVAEPRPALTASARDDVGNLRSGRKKACGAVEQKKGAQTKKVSQQERKRLRSWWRLENGRMLAARVVPKNGKGVRRGDVCR